MAVPNASQIRFLESKLNSKRELRLLQTDFQGRAGINWALYKILKWGLIE